MKKFLSICLVALCSVSAMYAETTPTADEKTQPNVECGSTVTVSATSVNEHFHFAYWEIQKTDGSLIATINPNSNNATYNASSGLTTTDSDGKETNVLTVNPLDHNLINLVNTTPGVTGTLTFEAFFTEDPKFKITIIAVDEAGNRLEDDDYQIVTTDIPSNYTDKTVDLTVDNKAGSCYRFDHWADAPTGGTNLGSDKTYTATYGSADKVYYAVYTNKVTIKVKTADNKKGTVAIVSVTPPAANPQ